MKIPVFLLLFAGAVAADGFGADSPWPRHIIDASDKQAGKLGADGVRLADANRDGLPDVVTGWENGDAIRVCLNPGPERAKAPWPGVTVGRVKGAEDAVFADLDGDGALDVVTSTEGKTKTVFVHWAPMDKEKYLNADAWMTAAVPVLEKAQMWMYALPFDANADGKLDLVLGSKSAGAAVGWLEAPESNPRDLSGWTYHKLCDAGWIMSIRAADLEGDGDQDVVFSDRKGNSTGVWMLDNVGLEKGEAGSVLGKPVRLGCAGKEVMFVDIVDLNNDGRLDVIAAVREREVVTLFQPDPPSAEWRQEITFAWEDAKGGRFGTAKAVRAGELDGKPGLEIAVTCEHAAGELSGVFWGRAYGMWISSLTNFDISGSEGVKYDRIELLDLDADGDLDLMTCEERENLGVFWYENPAKGSFQKEAPAAFPAQGNRIP